MAFRYPKRNDNTPFKGECLFVWISNYDESKEPKEENSKEEKSEEEKTEELKIKISHSKSLASFLGLKIRVVGSGVRPLYFFVDLGEAEMVDRTIVREILEKDECRDYLGKDEPRHQLVPLRIQ
ncbi:hypothetical protein IEQ34_005918 [Dendrobium chrysotoxum]|uniref:Uncharacterized protein n=1 Tax=Dendrobium chrysotoxum TaxID=161865 RepID=A0AAV7HEB4_DENCH|nr:hypothetical protein IEQ34_005918 [Dendrobium chrysotoxum]